MTVVFPGSKRLQKKATRSALRLLRKRSKKESRFAADGNHQISKKIVTEAQRTGRGIALEDLTGIRHRVRLRKPKGSVFTAGHSLGRQGWAEVNQPHAA
jgi:putative transposase